MALALPCPAPGRTASSSPVPYTRGALSRWAKSPALLNRFQCGLVAQRALHSPDLYPSNLTTEKNPSAPHFICTPGLMLPPCISFLPSLHRYGNLPAKPLASLPLNCLRLPRQLATWQRYHAMTCLTVPPAQAPRPFGCACHVPPPPHPPWHHMLLLTHGDLSKPYCIRLNLPMTAPLLLGAFNGVRPASGSTTPAPSPCTASAPVPPPTLPCD